METPFAIEEATAAASAGVVEPVVGASPGVEHDEIVNLSDNPAPVRVTCIDYGPTRAQLQEISAWQELEPFLARHRPEWSAVRWINVDGLANMHVIHALATKYDLHSLAVEDLLHLRQRAKGTWSV